MAEKWVSFLEIKTRVSIADILGKYGLLAGLRKQGSDELVDVGVNNPTVHATSTLPW